MPRKFSYIVNNDLINKERSVNIPVGKTYFYKKKSDEMLNKNRRRVLNE